MTELSKMVDQRDSACQAAAVVTDAAERVMSVFYDYAARGVKTTAAHGARAESDLATAMQELREAVKIADAMCRKPEGNARSVKRDDAAEVARELIKAANALDAEDMGIGIPVARKAVHAAIDALSRAMMLPE